MKKYIGIDIGGTNLRLGVVADDGAKPILLDEIRFQADFSDLCRCHPPVQAWQQILSTIAAAIDDVRSKHAEVSAVGIGFPGFIDPVTQCISQSPNLPNLSHVDLSHDLGQMLQLPVITENDALAAAYGEYIANPTPSGHLLYLGLGTGVGGGLILHGQPFQGQHGVAMEVGHIITEPQGRLCGCGNHGCMEQYASASGVAKSYFASTGQQRTAAEIASLGQQADAVALAAYQQAGTSLALALAHVLKVIDVTDIVIGGGMSAGWPLMQSAFEQQLTQDLIPALRGKLNLRISTMGDQAGMVGAAMLAKQALS